MPKVSFPEKFLWGAATSSYQIEGNNIYSDWWYWEQHYVGIDEKSPKEKSGIACDSYNRYEQDLDLAKILNHNAHRLSIEWARIEPEEGKFDMKEVEHYRNVLKAVKSRGMSTFVTLWHFTLPMWVRHKGGWKHPKTPHYFARYARLIAKELGGQIDFFTTLNEPIVYLAMRHVEGYWAQGDLQGASQFARGWIGLLRGHIDAYKSIKKINKSYKVGIVENVMYLEPAVHSLWNRLVCEIRKILQYRVFFTLIGGKFDFIGINYYFHDVVGPFDFLPKENNLSVGVERSDWGWEIYPKGIYEAVKFMSAFKKPMYITENGLADEKDEKRASFIVRHLWYLHKAIEDGYDVRGYFHWALLDNFEWAQGYSKKFGLIEVQRYNFLTRFIRPSAYVYGQICRDNEISEGLMKEYSLE